MARIVVGSYMVRYPLGGMMSYVLQYLSGFARLGHEVWFVEKASYPNACFDPRRNAMTDDAATGVGVVSGALGRLGLDDRWCFVDYAGAYYGVDRATIQEVLRTADVFVDMGTHGAWLDEVRRGGALAVLLDGEPGYTQIRLEARRRRGEDVDVYDRYYSNGWNVGTPRSPAPTAGLTWRHLPHPVDTSAVPAAGPARVGPVTTVMNWQSHEPVTFDGRSYGQKDVEFDKFIGLPGLVDLPLEVAVAGGNVPRAALSSRGWRLSDAHAVTASLDSFAAYVGASSAEFSVCKNVFVALHTGWFSDRSAFYLASGRPVILQDTGFSEHLPTGAGLFAVEDVDAAARALVLVATDGPRQRRAARDLACDLLDVKPVLSRFLDELRGSGA
jgi:hypothetical protein